MDVLIKKLPAGTTWFVGHNHRRAYLEEGDKKIIVVGAVFHREAKEGNPNYDVADFAVHDSETGGITLDGVRYDRKGVDERLRKAGFGRYLEVKKDV